MEGIIKRLVRDRGFGFIKIQTGEEYFFHKSEFEGNFDRLEEGQRVSFTHTLSPKGPRAEDVRVEL